MTRNRASSAGMATRHVGLVRYPYPTIQLFRVVTKTSSASVRLIEWFGHIDEQEKAYPAVFETTGYAFCSCNSLWRPFNRETGRSRLAEPEQREALDLLWNPDHWETSGPQVECDLEHNH